MAGCIIVSPDAGGQKGILHSLKSIIDEPIYRATAIADKLGIDFALILVNEIEKWKPLQREWRFWLEMFRGKVPIFLLP